MPPLRTRAHPAQAAAPSARNRARNRPADARGQGSRLARRAVRARSRASVLKQRSARARFCGVVGSTKDLPGGRPEPQSKEDDRDYTQALERIIKRLRARRRTSACTTPGDATAHGIEQSLMRAIKAAKLDEFERFAAESWTSERIRVLDAGARLQRSRSAVPRHHARQRSDGGPRKPDPARRRSGLPARVRDLGTARGQPRLEPVHPAPLSGRRQAGWKTARATSPTAW